MNVRNQVLGVWCCLVAVVFLGGALINLAHFVPPWPPTLTGEELAARYQEHSTGIRVGMIFLMFAGTLLAPITAVFSVLIKRMEGRASILTYTQLITGTVGLVLFVPPTVFWSAAAFRPDRALDSLVLLNDLGWLSFVMIVPPGILQVLVLGLAILQDKRPQPLFPRWVAYFNLWAAILFVPGGLVALFKTGPFAWNGVIAFWLPVGVFGTWLIIMLIHCLKAVKRPDDQPQPLSGAG